MELIDAIRARHSVRKYTDEPIGAEAVAAIREAVDGINRESGLNIQLVLDEPRAFNGMFITTYGQLSGVRNYLVMAGPKGVEAEEKVGYHGERLVLLAQTLGLNTCWVGLTYKKIAGAFSLREGDTVHCVIALGYGVTPGVQHPMRPAERFYSVVGPFGEEIAAASAAVPAHPSAAPVADPAATPAPADPFPPEWFLRGLEAALLAPTAVNQQKFKFFLHTGGRVEAKPLFSLIGYTYIDLGIAKCHFEIGAGDGHFQWI